MGHTSASYYNYASEAPPLTKTPEPTIMAVPPNNMKPDKLVLRRFEVDVIVDIENPKHPSVDALENRIGDGPQWMEGVRKVIVRSID